MDFGTNLRNLRIQRHLTQQKLADDMKMSQASITSYETGFREPSFEIVRRFAEYFRVSPSVLMPFGDVSQDEEIYRIAEALNSSPKHKHLYELTKAFSDRDMDVIIAVAQSMQVRQE